MHFAYRPELWESLFEMVALAAVTLTGFLSVALSMHGVQSQAVHMRTIGWLVGTSTTGIL